MLLNGAVRSVRPELAAAIGCLLVGAVASPAAASDTSECIAASEAAQSLRDQRALLAARERLVVCSREICPTPIRVDCVQQLAYVDASMPSLVLLARDARGEDEPNVRVLRDGAPFAEQLDGRALPVDPGPHTFRFESAGAPPFERRIVVAEGEKNRLVVITLEPSPPVAAAIPASAATGPSSAPSPAAKPATSGLRTAGWIVGGAGLAATIPMAALWVAAANDVSRMRSSCAPSAGGTGCSQGRIDSDRAEAVAGDVFMGVAAAALATGGALLLVHPVDHAHTGSLRILVGATPTRSGALVSAAIGF
jgi:hypothetical protein